METIEMHPAFTWDCDTCGREQFTRAVRPEMSSEDREELHRQHGVDPHTGGELLMLPMVVVCRDCGSRFETSTD